MISVGSQGSRSNRFHQVPFWKRLKGHGRNGLCQRHRRLRGVARIAEHCGFADVLLAVFLAAPAPAAAQRLSYVDLIHRLTDLEALAILPAADDRCAQWS